VSWIWMAAEGSTDDSEMHEGTLVDLISYYNIHMCI
jgi:hypothetical protein